MNEKRYCIGIDIFRIIAALLVIAIHTSPLGSLNETADLILTRILARVAVPFFFVTSGYFLVSRYSENSDKLVGFIKKTAIIYAAAIAVCLPVNIYNKYFDMENLLPNMIKDMVFDGTLYHLWYLPASIIGAAIAWILVKKTNYKTAFTVGTLLYIAGLFGDSYYGISEKIPMLKVFYDLIFQISDYTRNGLFFAPIFFIMGGFISDSRKNISLDKCICGFSVSFILMLAEAVILHSLNFCRHDSMYIFMYPVTFYLFNFLLNFKGRQIKFLRTISLIIYIIHPLAIIAIRLFSKILGLQKILVENSILHFLLVCIVSAAAAVSLTFLKERFLPETSKQIHKTDRAYVEINLRNLEHNADVLLKAMHPKSKIMAVVKTNAYGHGAYEIAVHLNKIGIDTFAAATVDEGIQLRKYGICGDILILGHTDIARAKEIKKYKLMQTLIDFEYACALNEQNIPINTHLKIDTGMHRLGISHNHILEIKKIFEMRNLNVCGIYTHLSCSDSLRPDDIDFTMEAINRFHNVIDELKSYGISIPKLHIQSSYGLLNYPEIYCDYVRIGIALYGVQSLPGAAVLNLNLRPVLTLKSKIVLIRHINKGETVGYGRDFTAERDSRIAVLPIGYGDGFPRSLSCGKGSVIIKGHKISIIGRVCMDSLTVDITDFDDIKTGDTAELICSELPAENVAKNSESIANELLCRLGERLKYITV